MKNLDVCLTPELLHLYPVEGKTVVVVDILRATSVMTTAIAHGMKQIIPVLQINGRYQTTISQPLQHFIGRNL